MLKLCDRAGGVIVLLVLLRRRFISMGFVRDMVVGQINSRRSNGKLQIKDWSFGWTSGVHIEGVQLTMPTMCICSRWRRFRRRFRS